MSRVKHIVGFSGGIDSQATAGVILDRHGPTDVILVNSNAGGNEHPMTLEFIEWYSANVHPVTHCNPILGDMWKTKGFAEKRGFDGSEPLTFLQMMKIKSRAPSRTAQFCTDILKLRPQKRWITWAFGPDGPYAGWDYIRYVGVRRDESHVRASTPDRKWDEYFDCEVVFPIADWPKKRCFDYVLARGERYNQLYTLGFNRVGCAPCINSGKSDVLTWLERSPDMIDKIRSWEEETGHTYFAPLVPGLKINTIDDVVAWAKTTRGGRQFAMRPSERPSCESQYGLCE